MPVAVVAVVAVVVCVGVGVRGGGDVVCGGEGDVVQE
jgi:hypothetical protein